MLEVLVGLFILLVLGFLILLPVIAIALFIWLRRRKRKKVQHQFHSQARLHFTKKRHYSGALIDISNDPSFESNYQFSGGESRSYAESSGNENWESGVESSNNWDWSGSSSDSTSSDSGWSSSDSSSSSSNDD